MARDTLLVACVSLLVLGGLLFGVTDAVDAHARRAEEAASARRTVGASNLSASALNLPSGVQVDPNTGLMVGFDLDVGAGVTGVPWETLRAYEYEKGLANMPEAIARLDGQRVAMLGFLWAIYDYDDIKKFGLVGSHWSCCYGIPPGMSDVVIVELEEGHTGLSQTLNPVRVTGTFHVGEILEGGYPVAIFRITDARAVVLEY